MKSSSANQPTQITGWFSVLVRPGGRHWVVPAVKSFYCWAFGHDPKTILISGGKLLQTHCKRCGMLLIKRLPVPPPPKE